MVIAKRFRARERKSLPKRCGKNARFLFGFEKADDPGFKGWAHRPQNGGHAATRWLTEVNGDCEEISGTRTEVTSKTMWTVNSDWATTKDGKVFWVTSWHTVPQGHKWWWTGGPQSSYAGNPNSADTYKPQKANG